jgi:hypothetical protein
VASIRIQSGGVEAERTFDDDRKASDTLTAFYLDQGLGPADAEPKTQLDAILTWIVERIQEKAALRHVQIKRAEAEVEAKELYRLLPDKGPAIGGAVAGGKR